MGYHVKMEELLEIQQSTYSCHTAYQKLGENYDAGIRLPLTWQGQKKD